MLVTLHLETVWAFLIFQTRPREEVMFMLVFADINLNDFLGLIHGEIENVSRFNLMQEENKDETIKRCV